MSASPREIVRNNVKEKLARGEVVASMTVRLSRSIEIASIAKTAGFDSIYVDVEHSSLSLETTSQICIAALAIGIAPFVRVPNTRPEHVSRALDAGALGVIAPHIRSAAAAREVVASAKFPPLGGRSAAGVLPHLEYRSVPAAEANAAMNEATMVVVQFETADAIEKADEIVAVEGVDMVLMGTNDLLADMGLPGQYEHERVRDAYARTLAACRRHGKHLGVGGLATRPKARRRVRENGRALRLDRHRPRFPARRGHRAREAGARDRAAMSGEEMNGAMKMDGYEIDVLIQGFPGRMVCHGAWAGAPWRSSAATGTSRWWTSAASACERA